MLKIFVTAVILVLVTSIQAQTPRSVEDFQKRGEQRYTQGDYDGAISDFTRAVEMSSRLGMQSELRGNKWTAAEEAEKIRVVDPRTATAYVSRGVARLAKGDADGAVLDFNQALAISPGLIWAYYNRGTAWLAKGDTERALADYDKSLKLDSRFVGGYTGRGNARLDKGDVAGAFADYEQAIRLAPHNARVYDSRGDARRLTGETEGALTDFERAMRLDPKFANPYYGRGMVRFHRRELEGAIADFTKALSLDGQLALAYANRGLAFLLQGREAEAERDLSCAVELAPGLRSRVEASAKAAKRLRRYKERSHF